VGRVQAVGREGKRVGFALLGRERKGRRGRTVPFQQRRKESWGR